MKLEISIAMDALKTSPDRDEYTDLELDKFGEAILLVEKMKANKALWEAVQKRLQGKVKEITSTKDLRTKASQMAMEDDDEGEED